MSKELDLDPSLSDAKACMCMFCSCSGSDPKRNTEGFPGVEKSLP